MYLAQSTKIGDTFQIELEFRNLEMLAFEEREKPEYPEKNHS